MPIAASSGSFSHLEANLTDPKKGNSDQGVKARQAIYSSAEYKILVWASRQDQTFKEVAS